MKKIIILIALATTFASQTVFARTVEVDVHGMTCAFCVDSLERKFGAMNTVSKVDVSLKLKKIRLETQEDLPTVETIKKAVLDAGFTPTKVSILSGDKVTAPAEKQSNNVDTQTESSTSPSALTSFWDSLFGSDK